MKRKTGTVLINVTTIILTVLLITACSNHVKNEPSKLTKPHLTTCEETQLTNCTTSMKMTENFETQVSLSDRVPMTQISVDDFRSISSLLGYSVTDVNYDGSGLDALLSGSDPEHLFCTGYSLFPNEESAKAGISNYYNRQLEGEESGGFIGELSFEEKEGYDIVIAKSTDENMPSYSVCIRVNKVLLDAFCFSTNAADIDVVNDFFMNFGYSVE